MNVGWDDAQLPPARAALIAAGETVTISTLTRLESASVLFEPGFMAAPKLPLCVFDMSPLAPRTGCGVPSVGGRWRPADALWPKGVRASGRCGPAIGRTARPICAARGVDCGACQGTGADRGAGGWCAPSCRHCQGRRPIAAHAGAPFPGRAGLDPATGAAPYPDHPRGGIACHHAGAGDADCAGGRLLFGIGLQCGVSRPDRHQPDRVSQFIQRLRHRGTPKPTRVGTMPHPLCAARLGRSVCGTCML